MVSSFSFSFSFSFWRSAATVGSSWQRKVELLGSPYVGSPLKWQTLSTRYQRSQIVIQICIHMEFDEIYDRPDWFSMHQAIVESKHGCDLCKGQTLFPGKVLSPRLVDHPFLLQVFSTNCSLQKLQTYQQKMHIHAMYVYYIQYLYRYALQRQIHADRYI